MNVIHAFNDKGLAALDPHWAGGRPRPISDDDIAFIVATATTRPVKLGCPFTHWSLRKLVQYLKRCHERRIVISRLRNRRNHPARSFRPYDAHFVPSPSGMASRILPTLTSFPTLIARGGAYRPHQQLVRAHERKRRPDRDHPRKPKLHSCWVLTAARRWTDPRGNSGPRTTEGLP